MDNKMDNETLIKITKAVLKRRGMVPIRDYEDYFFEGVLEGIKAIEEYDPNKNSKLTTYVFLKINYKMSTLVRANNAKKRDGTNNIALENTLLEETGVVQNFEFYNGNVSVEDELIEKEFKERFHNILREQLSEEEYSYLSLFLEGYGIPELSKMLDLTNKQASNKLYYIRKKLKKNKDKFENL